MKTLTDKQRRVLSVLARVDERKDCLPDAREVAQGCGEHSRASDWARASLQDLRKRGLVELAGHAMSGARTWRITSAGREALGAHKSRVRTLTASS